MKSRQLLQTVTPFLIKSNLLLPPFEINAKSAANIRGKKRKQKEKENQMNIVTYFYMQTQTCVLQECRPLARIKTHETTDIWVPASPLSYRFLKTIQNICFVYTIKTILQTILFSRVTLQIKYFSGFLRLSMKYCFYWSTQSIIHNGIIYYRGASV